MNNAGLPGTGLGGLFYVLLALWMPVSELVATTRGRSSRRRWRLVATQFGLACGILVAVVATALPLAWAWGLPRESGPAVPSGSLALLLVAPLTLLVLVLVLRIWARLGSCAVAPSQSEHYVGRHRREQARAGH